MWTMLADKFLFFFLLLLSGAEATDSTVPTETAVTTAPSFGGTTDAAAPSIGGTAVTTAPSFAGTTDAAAPSIGGTADTAAPSFAGTADTLTQGGAGTTTSIRTTTTAVLPTPPCSIGLPVDLGTIFFKIKLSIRFRRLFDDILADMTSSQFKLYSAELAARINVALNGCPGFNAKLTAIIMFREHQHRNATGVVPYAEVPGSDTDANYTTSYDASYIINNPDGIANIVSFLLGTGLEKLKKVTLNDSAADAEYLNSNMNAEVTDAGRQLEAAKANPCGASQEAACTACSQCNYYNETKSLFCSPLCPAPAQTCIIKIQASEVLGSCSCSLYYLMMAGNCVHQNIVIGIFAGVGGALFLGILIALIIISILYHRLAASRQENRAGIYKKPESTELYEVLDLESRLTDATLVHQQRTFDQPTPAAAAAPDGLELADR